MAKGFNVNDLMDASKWKMTEKKSYEVYVCRPVLGTAVTNKLEGASYTTDKNKQFVMSGTLGEQWVIDAKKLASTYTLADGREINAEVLKGKKVNKEGEIDWLRLKTKRNSGQKNWAIMLPASVKNYSVKTSWGDTLLANRAGIAHGLGDFLVCADAGGKPNFNDMWVVNGIVFPTTYDMRPFPGVMAEVEKRMKGKNLKETVVPKSIVNKTSTGTTSAGTTSAGAAASKQPATRGAKRIMYSVTKRYVSGKSTIGYDVQSESGDKTNKLTREQLCYLLGRGQIKNCTGSVNQGRMVIRGKGISLDTLPTVEVEPKASAKAGASTNTSAASTSKAGVKKSTATQFAVIGKIKQGNSVVGYMVDGGKGQKRVGRSQFIDLVKSGKVSNVKWQNYQGKVLLRGVGIEMKALPEYTVEGKLA